MKIVVGLSAWIIQDGNYDDFQVGDTSSFALEFYCENIKREGCKKHYKKVTDSIYELCGQVIYLDKGSWVIDAGFLAYQDSRPPKGLKKGDFISSKFYIGIDPFFYFESLKRKEFFPDLTYKWKIEKIEIETTPFIEQNNTFVRDKRNVSFIDKDKTNAWSDFEGNAHYLVSAKVSTYYQNSQHSE